MSQESNVRKSKIRRSIWRSQKKRCFYCRQALPLHVATIDHITPLSRGGTNAQYNLVIACNSCNNDKAASLWPGKWTPGQQRTLTEH